MRGKRWWGLARKRLKAEGEDWTTVWGKGERFCEGRRAKNEVMEDYKHFLLDLNTWMKFSNYLTWHISEWKLIFNGKKSRDFIYKLSGLWKSSTEK